MKTIKYINTLLKEELLKVRKDNETDVYSYLDSYLNRVYLCNVKELNDNEKNRITSVDKTWDGLIRYIENSIKTILECYRTYAAGKIGESIQLMSDFLEKNNAPLRVGKIGADNYFYRMRRCF